MTSSRKPAMMTSKKPKAFPRAREPKHISGDSFDDSDTSSTTSIRKPAMMTSKKPKAFPRALKPEHIYVESLDDPDTSSTTSIRKPAMMTSKKPKAFPRAWVPKHISGESSADSDTSSTTSTLHVSPAKRLAPKPQPTQAEKDFGTLAKLPPELRNRIYKLVLVKDGPVKLQCYQPPGKLDSLQCVRDGKRIFRVADEYVAPVGHKRDPDHRGRYWNGWRWIEIPSKTALTMVNKKLNSETSSILYGCNTFDFTTTVALERFLNLIRNNKQHLRAVGLSCSPVGHSLASGNRAVTALMAANSLHTLRLTNCPVEHIQMDLQLVRNSIKNHVEMFAPLLASIHASLQASGQGKDILNAVQIIRRLPGERAPRSEITCTGHCGRSCVWHRRNKPIYHLAEEDCSETCQQACEESIVRATSM